MKTSLLGRIVRVADNLFRDTKSGSYYGVKKIAGKRKLHSLKTSDRVTANGRLAKWFRELEAGDANAMDLKFEALLQNFLTVREGKAKGTRATEKAIANTIRRSFPRGMGVPVRQIRTSDLLKWLASEAKARSWGPVYYNRCRFFFRQLFDLAIADGVISETANPFRSKLIPPRKLEKTRRNIPTIEQFEKIVESVRSQRDNADREESADFLAFLGLAGVGQAEAASMKWDDISETHINFVRQKTRRSFTVPIYAWLAPLVAKLRAKPMRIDGRVFGMRNGKKAIGRACERLEFPHFTQRNLRAMCIKRLYDTGVPVKRIALWQGHNDGGKLIQQIYTEVFCDSDAAAEAADLALVTRGAAAIRAA